MRWHELARGPALLEVERAVDEGSRLLREGRGKMDTVIAKGDRDFATALDVEAERLIRSSLQRLAPDIAFLGEERGGPAPASQPIWVLDPIDGTVNFARGSPLCAISLALVELGLPRMAIVDFPFLGERYLAAEGAGAYLNGAPIRTVERSLENSVVGFTDFSVGHDAPSENPIHLRLMAALAATALRVRVHGSEGLDLAWLASGRLDAAIMLSNLPWDVSGGTLLVREAGGAVFDLDGSEHGLASAATIASTRTLKRPLLAVLQSSL
ncbi:MAG: inositol monophosphatase family protein [Solirubrobacteraceae bacterium]